MTHISDVDRTVFADAHSTVLEFTDEQQKQIHAIADQLRDIMDAAKKKGPGSFDKGSFGKGFQVG